MDKIMAHDLRLYSSVKREFSFHAGTPENCQLYIGEGGHRYYKAGSWPFIRKHFNAKIAR